MTGTRNYPVTASWDHEHGAKLITVVMVVMALSLAGCTTSTVRPTGIVTGVAYACSGLPSFVTGRHEVKVSLFSGVEARYFRDDPLGSRVQVLSPSWDLSAGRMVAFQGCDRAGR